MPYKDLVPVKVWSIYRDKNGERKLAPLWMAQVHKSIAHNFEALRNAIKRRGGELQVSDVFRPWAVQAKAYKEKPKLALNPRVGSYHMAGLAFDALMNEKLLTMSISEFKQFVKNYGFTGISKENWHYQAAKLPDGYKNIKDVIRAVGNWKG